MTRSLVNSRNPSAYALGYDKRAGSGALREGEGAGVAGRELEVETAEGGEG